MRIQAVTLFGLVLLATAFTSSFAFAYPRVGAPAYIQEGKMKVNNKMINVIEIGFYYHEMNLKPDHAAPIGLEEFVFIQDNPASGNARRCVQYYKRVLAGEQKWKGQKTYPYLEINFNDNAKPLNKTGLSVMADKDVQCWEAIDIGQPLY